MCLAVPAKVVERDGSEAVVDLGGNQMSVNVVLTPEVTPGQWVLVHAGFAISTIEENDALETWTYLRACYEGSTSELEDEAGGTVALAHVPDGGATG